MARQRYLLRVPSFPPPRHTPIPPLEPVIVALSVLSLPSAFHIRPARPHHVRIQIPHSSASTGWIVSCSLLCFCLDSSVCCCLRLRFCIVPCCARLPASPASCSTSTIHLGSCVPFRKHPPHLRILHPHPPPSSAHLNHRTCTSRLVCSLVAISRSIVEHSSILLPPPSGEPAIFSPHLTCLFPHLLIVSSCPDRNESPLSVFFLCSAPFFPSNNDLDLSFAFSFTRSVRRKIAFRYVRSIHICFLLAFVHSTCQFNIFGTVLVSAAGSLAVLMGLCTSTLHWTFSAHNRLTTPYR